MNSNKIILFLFVTLFSSSWSEDEDMDYSSEEDVDQKVHKLRVEGAEYLEKVMKQLQNDRNQVQMLEMSDITNLMYNQRKYLESNKNGYDGISQIYNISGPTPVPDIEAEIVPVSPPPISLTKEELLALYEAAVLKAQSLQLSQGSKKPEEEYSHSLAASSSDMAGTPVKPALQGQMEGPASGYYYYYFPIKSFMTPGQQIKPTAVTVTTPPPQQLHITMVEAPNRKAVEPLFMAISGFIGMALMFLFSILFVPKFTKLRSKNAYFKETPDEMATFAQIVLQAMTGKDCSERLACEIAKIFHGLKSDNKPLRILEILLPPNLSQQIAQIRRAAGKKAKCEYIPCKEKKPPIKNIKTQKPRPWKKKETKHDLWMKHFEKGKLNMKQSENAWNRKPLVKRT